MTWMVQSFSIRPFFRWYDLWVGAYWDTATWTLYVCPVPMLGVRIALPWRQSLTKKASRKLGKP